jgi:hypothetical protein
VHLPGMLSLLPIPRKGLETVSPPALSFPVVSDVMRRLPGVLYFSRSVKRDLCLKN